MRKIAFFVLTFLAAVLVFGVILFLFSQSKGKGALQVTASSAAKVYLDGKLIGSTPLCKCDRKDLLSEGEYTLKLKPAAGNFDSFEQKITISPKVLTVVDKTFAQTGFDNASIISLNPIGDPKTAQISVVTFPGKSQVYVDNNLKGESPVLVDSINVADHELKISKNGYKDKIVRVRTVLGYKLDALVFLGLDSNTVTATQSSAGIFPASSTSSVTILDTPTGFLRVRDQASLSGTEIGQVKPGETYKLLSEQDGWYQIEFGNIKGWINSQYANKTNQETK